MTQTKQNVTAGYGGVLENKQQGLNSTAIVPPAAATGKAQAAALLDALRFDRGLLQVKCIKPGSMTPRMFWYKSPADLLADWSNLDQVNRQGYSVYFGVGTFKAESGTKDNLAWLLTVHADLDGKDYVANEADWQDGMALALSMLGNMPPSLHPAVVVDTGHGYHGYWPLGDPLEASPENIARVEAVNRSLVSYLGADKAAIDASRVLRLPGFQNVKDPAAPYPVVLLGDPAPRRFTLDDFTPIMATATPVRPITSAPITAGMNGHGRAGDDYSARGDWSTLLTAHGWTLVSQHDQASYWCKPGSFSRDVHARLNWQGDGRLKVYTTKAAPLDPVVYTLFSAYTVLEHGGDFHAAAKALAALGYGTAPRMNGTGHAPDLPPLDLADLDAPPEDPTEEAALHAAATPRPAAADQVATADQVEADDDLDLVPEAPDIPAITWLDDYAELMIELTCAPRSFHRLGGLVALSMAVGPGARLRMSFGDVHGNLYAAIIGESSAFYKTTAMRQVRGLLVRAALPHYLLQPQFTSEGLTKALSEQATGLILRDELSTLFASHRQKYSQFVKSDLTAIFDGDPFGKLKAGEVQKVDKPYLSILGTTTPDGFYNSITGDDWRTGFLARWLFALPDSLPDFDSDSRLLTQTDEARLQGLAATLIKISARPGGDFTLDADAHHRWNTWRKEERRQAFELGGDVVSAIASRYGTYALKFAMLLSAVTDYGRITDNNMVAAIALAGGYKTNALRLFTDRRSHGVTGAKVQRVFAAILSGGGTATTKTILQTLHMTASELQPLLDVLCEQGAVTADKAGRGFRFTVTTNKLPIKSWVR